MKKHRRCKHKKLHNKPKKPLVYSVSYKELNNARFTWRSLYSGVLSSSFYNFIGEAEYNYQEQRVYCTKHAYDKIRMLNSPHAYALMKAFIIQTGYQNPLRGIRP